MFMIDTKENIKLAPYTTFKIGGEAKYFVEVSAEEALLEALQYAKENNLEFFILGGGSNVLFSDEGFGGIVIKFKVQSVKLKVEVQNLKFLINCWAGDSLANVVKFSVENNLTGLEWAAGIPGTVGGAVRGNAGAFGGCIADSIESVKVIVNKKIDPSTSPAKAGFSQDDIRVVNYKLSDCKFGYRNSIFKQSSNLIILSCVLKLQRGDGEKVRNRIGEILAKRAENQPKEASSGSFFKNPVVKNRNLIEKFENDMKIKSKDNKVPAGWLIGKAGMGGKKIGGAMVSEKHNNFIVNTGNATAKDVITLEGLIKQQVWDKFEIELQEEVRLVGF
jgi:UDP-N-acetylmuramate dehydrogenase